jgi:hypothetical protein
VLASVAALIAITSVMGGMTGASVAPAAADVKPAIAAAAAAPSVTTGASARLSVPMLDTFAHEDVTQIASQVATHPALIGKFLLSPPSSSVMEETWSSYSPAQQRNLVNAVPQLVGNLDGIPFNVRVQANAISLKREVAQTKKQLAGVVGKGVRFDLEQQLSTLQKVQIALKPVKGGPKRSLWILDDTTGDMRAAVVVGNLNTAHYISYLVPGMYMSVDEQIDAWATTAQELYSSQVAWLHRTAAMRPSQVNAGVATVAWIGYQTPELMNIGGLQLATQGASFLEHSISGLLADRKSNPPYLSILAHSYGSTAALIALQSGTVSVNALALLGSPGSEAQSVADLDVKNGNVYVAQAGLDPVVHSAFFGSDPGSASYGAHHMSVSGGIDPIDHQKLSASYGHNAYFTKGTESMRNLALIGVGLDQLITVPGSNKAATTDAAK